MSEPTTEQHDAWLLDLYPEGGRMVLWFIVADGRRLRLTRPFAPLFYVEGVETRLTPAERRRFAQTVERSAGLEPAGLTEWLDFWTGRPRPVLALRVLDLDRTKTALLALADRFPALTYFNCDIPPEILFCYETGLFPTARCRIAWRGEMLEAFALLDDALAVDYDPPPWRGIELSATGQFSGKRPRLHTLTVKDDERVTTWDDGDPREILHSLRRRLEQVDPDIIWTDGGDTTLMAVLFGMAQQLRIPLGLDRDPRTLRKLDDDGHTYMSYGQVLYHAPDRPLFGRLHLDRHNSFWVGECHMDGLAEVARMGRIPLQRAARRSIGTGISSIQLEWAYRQGYLIPWRKAQHEAWKSVSLLLKADRGGLVFQPIPGAYEAIWELDFVSMYPTIMVSENVSPETVNCTCCEPRPAVPELGYGICRRRKGLTAETLRPVIEKRAYYKAQRNLAKARGDEMARDRFDRRQNALKWLLVCCFGYLGYRNARFGRIEAHESTCAFSREKLLNAKAVCEGRGFRVLHAIVDSFWIERPGTTRGEINTLCEEINAATNLRIAIEGLYRWVVFLPSRQNPDLPVPNRYFGVFEDGTLKCRGIEACRSDQARFVQDFQRELLDVLSGAATLAEARAGRGRLLEMLGEAEAALRRHEVPRERLFLQRRTSRLAEDYKDNNMTAVAARQARRAGIALHAGQAVRFLVLSRGDRDVEARLALTALLRPEDQYDAEFYVEQLRRAAATVLEPIFGEPLAEMLGLAKKQPARRATTPVRAATRQLDLFLDLEASA